VKSVWGIHDFVPDLGQFKKVQDGNRLHWEPPEGETPGGYSGCGWQRIVMPFEELTRHGWRTGYAWGRMPKEFSDYRVVVAQRTDKYEALPDWRRMRARHRLVYELDDDVFSTDPVNAQAHRVYANPLVQEAVRTAAQVSDVITVSTQRLAEIMARETGHHDIRVITNCVPGALLEWERPRDQRHMVVGWAGGASHGADLAMIADPVRKFLDRNKKAVLHLIGQNYEGTFGRPVRWTSWVRATPDLKYYRGFDFDVALCPLTGTVFDQSKSALKALEPMALGIPVLASDCEPYRGTVIDGVNGYLIKKPNEWGRRLHELANDKAAREEMGAKARETARAHTIEANWQRWAAVYEELL